MSTVNNAIPFVPENTIDPAAGLNLSLNTVDALLQVQVLTIGANTPPGSPANGARYIVGTSPTGAWAGQANKLARRLDGAWQFFDARTVVNAADGLLYVRSASTWSAVSGGGGGGEANTASNLGAGEGLYSAKVGVDLRFKSLVAGANVTLSSDADTVTISSSGGGGGGGSGTVTSVALSAPTGFSVSGSPVTTTGTLALSFAAGYSLPTNSAQTEWSTAYGWGDHATAGYEKELTAGANITIDRTDPDNPVISSTAAGGGGGDVTGPSSSTNNAVALFDGTSGKLLKDGVVLGTAATTDAADYATAAQGALAASALQPPDIGSTVQAYDADTAKLDVAQNWSAAQRFQQGTSAAMVAMGAGSAINLALGNGFTKTISAATTLSLSNVPASGLLTVWLLELTNGGSAAVTWWGGIAWAEGSPPSLTASGRDVLGFYTADGGTTTIGFVVGLGV